MTIGPFGGRKPESGGGGGRGGGEGEDGRRRTEKQTVEDERAAEGGEDARGRAGEIAGARGSYSGIETKLH